MKIKIEKGIKLPSPADDRYADMVEAMKTMEIGDSFVYSVKYPEFFRVAARRANIKAAIRLVHSNGTKAKGKLSEYRVWRVK